MRKLFWIITLLIMIGLPSYFILAEPVDNVPTNEPSGNVGAYYDESWEATRFLYTYKDEGEGGSPDRLRYASGANPPSEAGVVSLDGDDKYEGTATLSNELLVIEWQSAGNLSFVTVGGGL